MSVGEHLQFDDQEWGGPSSVNDSHLESTNSDTRGPIVNSPRTGTELTDDDCEDGKEEQAIDLLETLQLDALEIRLTPATAEDMLALISRYARSTDPIVVGAHNLHSVYLFHTDRDFNDFYQKSDIVLVDGWPILAMLNRERTKSGKARLPSRYRIGSTDWVPDAIALTEVTRVCVLGARSRSNTQFIQRQQAENPGVKFLGVPADPWEPSAADDVVERIRRFTPHLTVVGMGMPLQEGVTLSLVAGGVGGVIATIGGAIDQLSGQQSHAPRWTGRLRVEWLWRLGSDPRRLAYRYLVEPLKLAKLLRQHGKATL